MRKPSQLQTDGLDPGSGFSGLTRSNSLDIRIVRLRLNSVRIVIPDVSSLWNVEA